MEGNPTGAMGLADYLGWDWKSKANIPIICVPGCPVQPDNFMETLLYLLHQAADPAVPMIPLMARCVQPGCSPTRSTKAATAAAMLAKAEKTSAPHGDLHGYRTIADIMRSLNPFTGTFYREALQMSRLTREMFCLMEGRHVHLSTLYPGGVGTVPSVQLFNDYLVRLMKYVEFMKEVVPLHDDLFDFFYEPLPGYEQVGRRRVLLGCWGSFNDPEACDYTYLRMSDWGRKTYVTPGIVVDGKLLTTDLVDINLGSRIISLPILADELVRGQP